MDKNTITGLVLIGILLVAVSYTHLHVYKRQPSYSGAWKRKDGEPFRLRIFSIGNQLYKLKNKQ